MIQLSFLGWHGRIPSSILLFLSKMNLPINETKNMVSGNEINENNGRESSCRILNNLGIQFGTLARILQLIF